MNNEFDINLYLYEKKKQKIDEKTKNKDVNKIQINFKNSFVNEKTQNKYDKIIECNNIKNQEKIKIKVDNDNIANESEFIIIEGVDKTINESSIKNIIDDTIKYNSDEEKENDINKEIENYKNDDNISNKFEEYVNKANKYIDDDYDKVESNIFENYHNPEINNIQSNKFSNYNNTNSENDYDTVNFQEDIVKDCQLEEDKYDKFLEDTLAQSEKSEFHLKLRKQMKDIVHNMKDRKKDKTTEKCEMKKNLIMFVNKQENNVNEILQNKEINENDIINIPISKNHIIKSDIIHKNNEFSKEISISNYVKTKSMIENVPLIEFDSLLKETDDNKVEAVTFGFKMIKHNLEEDIYTDFTKEEINNISIDKLDENEVTSIHQSIQIENGLNIDLDEFIKENTIDQINDNTFVDNRLIVFENCDNKEE